MDRALIELLFAIVFFAFSLWEWKEWKETGNVRYAVWTGVLVGWGIDNVIEAVRYSFS